MYKLPISFSVLYGGRSVGCTAYQLINMSEKERLNYFISVAKLGSVKAASQFYNVKPAHVYRKIHSLENEYGIKLFIRNYRGLDLTKEGKNFFIVAQKIVAEIEKFTSEVELKPLTSPKSLVVGSTYGITAYWIAPNVPKFLDNHPHTTIKLATSKDGFDMDTIDLCIGTKILNRDD